MSTPRRSSRRASKKFAIPERTLRRWVQHQELFGELPCETRRKRKGKGPRVFNRLVTPVVKRSLRGLVTNMPWLYLDEFQQKLVETTGVRLTLSSIWRVLTKELGWTLKIAEKKARERNEVERALHHVHMSQATNDPAQFVFIGETAKDRKASRRRRGWARRGK
jgi:transposase